MLSTTIWTKFTVQLLWYSLSQRVRHIFMETARLRTALSCPFNLLRPEQSPRRPFLFKSSTGEHHFMPGFRKGNSWGVSTYSCKHLIVGVYTVFINYTTVQINENFRYIFSNLNNEYTAAKYFRKLIYYKNLINKEKGKKTLLRVSLWLKVSD